MEPFIWFLFRTVSTLWSITYSYNCKLGIYTEFSYSINFLRKDPCLNLQPFSLFYSETKTYVFFLDA